MEDGHVRKLPSGGWVADFRVNGKRRQLKGKTKAEAKARMSEALGEGATASKRTRTSGFTIGQAWALTAKVRWAGQACETSANGYARQVVAFYGPERELASITVRDFEDMRQHFLRKGNKPSTVNWKASTLQSMFADAETYEHITKDDIPRFPKRLPMDNVKERVFEDGELRAFCTYLQAIEKHEAAHLLVFLCEVGCRFSEAARLIGRDVDLQANRVVFRKTKNRQARTVPLTTAAADAIKPFMPVLSGQRIWSLRYKQFQYLFDRAKAAVGLADDELLTIHVTRHTCASRLTRNGVSLLNVRKWGGWRSLSSVQRYAHVDLQALEAAAKLVQCVPCGGQNPLQKTLATDLQLNLYGQSGSEY